MAWLTAHNTKEACLLAGLYLANFTPGTDLLSRGAGPSTLGPAGLRFRVRNGNGRFPSGMGTRKPSCTGDCITPHAFCASGGHRKPRRHLALRRVAQVGRQGGRRAGGFEVKPSTDSYGSAARLAALPLPADRPAGLAGVLPPCGVGDLIFGLVSRLDAFSATPFRTWLPSVCPWRDNWYTSGASTPVLSY